MIAFSAALATIMILGAVTAGSLNQEVFSAKGGNEKVDICHKGNTISVSEKAITSHVAHGDFVGTGSDGPDCDHPTNADNQACVELLTCDDCQDAYEVDVEACGAEPACLTIALKIFDVCRD